MSRTIPLLTVLLLAVPTLVAQDGKKPRDPFAPVAPSSSAKDRSKVKVVDPLDFRQPIPDPEEGVIPTYDEKRVRFTGVLVGSGEDGREKRRWFALQVNITALVRERTSSQQPKVKLKPGTDLREARPELMTVRVYPRTDDTRLRSAASGQLELTVEGEGQILLGTSNLVIHDATVVAVNTVAPAPRR